MKELGIQPVCLVLEDVTRIHFIRSWFTSDYYAGSQRVAMQVQDGVIDEIYYLFSDHLGSTSITTDSDGNWYSELRYTAWGTVRYASGEMLTDYTYTGQRSEVSNFGLMYYNARWYDSALGRFAEADSIIPEPGNPLAWDRYSYVRNNPIKFVDPAGNQPEHPIPDFYIKEIYTNYISVNVNSVTELDRLNRHGVGAQYIVVPSPIYAQKYANYVEIPKHENLCGHLAFAAIYESEKGGNAIGMIWEMKQTGPSEMSGDWASTISDIPGWSAKYASFSMPDDFINALLSGSYLMIGTVLDTETGKLVDESHIDQNGFAEHWVAVTSVSNYGVCIYNPFTNSVQYYQWASFTTYYYGAVYVIDYYGVTQTESEYQPTPN